MESIEKKVQHLKMVINDIIMRLPIDKNISRNQGLSYNTVYGQIIYLLDKNYNSYLDGVYQIPNFMLNDNDSFDQLPVRNYLLKKIETLNTKFFEKPEQVECFLMEIQDDIREMNFKDR